MKSSTWNSRHPYDRFKSRSPTNVRSHIFVVPLFVYLYVIFQVITMHNLKFFTVPFFLFPTTISTKKSPSIVLPGTTPPLQTRLWTCFTFINPFIVRFSSLVGPYRTPPLHEPYDLFNDDLRPDLTLLDPLLTTL